MKTIILMALMFFTLNTFSQQQNIRTDLVNWNKVDRKTSVDKAGITFELLLQYEKDCYNDSTVSYYYTMCDNGCWDVPCNKGDKDFTGWECPAHWKHKIPTFEGFIKYIKLKYY